MDVKPAKSLRPPPRRLVREKPKIVRSEEEDELIRARAREAEENKLDVWKKRRGSLAAAALSSLEPEEVPAFALDYTLHRFWELQRSQEGASPHISKETAACLRKVALSVVEEHVEELTKPRVFSMTDPKAQERREAEKQERAIAQMKENEKAQKDKAKEKEERARRMEEELKAAATQEGEEKPRKKSKSRSRTSKSSKDKEEDNESPSPSHGRKREKGSRKGSKTKKQVKIESESAINALAEQPAAATETPSETTRQGRAMTEGAQSRVAHRRVNRSLKSPPLLSRSGIGSVVAEPPLPVIEVTTQLVDLTQLVDHLEEALFEMFPSPDSLPPACRSKDFLDFYHLSIQGPRPANEDEYVVIEHVNDWIGLPHEDQYAYCGVYDGHRGKFASLYTRSQLHTSIFTHPDFPNDKAFHDSFLRTDKAVNAVQHRDGFLCGTTALSVFIRNNEELIVANAGDCRGFISRAGEPVEIADRHIPNRPDEMERIKSMGGIVICFGTWRVNGSLAVSRSIGDLDSRSLVIADPEITRIPLTKDDEFLVLASDGLWDEVTGEEMIQIVKQTVATKGRDHVCQVLCDTGVERNTKDNVTVVALFFDHENK